MRRLVPLAAVAVLSSLATATAIALPAFAEGDPDDETRAARAERRAFDGRFRRFAACMREHGFDLGGDVVVRVERDRVTIDGKDVDGEAFRAAERACGGPPFPALGGVPGLGALPPLRNVPDDDEVRAQRDAFLADVAERLGVSVERLRGALRDAAIARIDALERDGALSATHADALRELARSGDLPLLRGPAFGPPGLWDRRDGGARFHPLPRHAP